MQIAIAIALYIERDFIRKLKVKINIKSAGTKKKKRFPNNIEIQSPSFVTKDQAIKGVTNTMFIVIVIYKFIIFNLFMVSTHRRMLEADPAAPRVARGM